MRMLTMRRLLSGVLAVLLVGGVAGAHLSENGVTRSLPPSA